MENTTKTPETSQEEVAPSTKPRANGMTDEQVRYARAAFGRRKNDPEYLRIWEEGVAEYRKKIQEELECDLNEMDKK
jgi:hypothetical protein